MCTTEDSTRHAVFATSVGGRGQPACLPANGGHGQRQPGSLRGGSRGRKCRLKVRQFGRRPAAMVQPCANRTLPGPDLACTGNESSQRPGHDPLPVRFNASPRKTRFPAGHPGIPGIPIHHHHPVVSPVWRTIRAHIAHDDIDFQSGRNHQAGHQQHDRGLHGLADWSDGGKEEGEESCRGSQKAPSVPRSREQ
jgi:hypothetical protein